MPSTVSPALGQDVLEGSAGFPLKLLLQKLKFELFGWEEKKPSPGLTVLGVSASVQGPKLAGEFFTTELPGKPLLTPV